MNVTKTPLQGMLLQTCITSQSNMDTMYYQTGPILIKKCNHLPDVAMLDTGVLTYCEDQNEDEENTDKVSNDKETLCN